MNKLLHFLFGVPLSRGRKITYWALFTLFFLLGILFVTVISNPDSFGFWPPVAPRGFIQAAWFYNLLWLYFAMCLIINKLVGKRIQKP